MKINGYAIMQAGGSAEPFAYETSLGNTDVLVKITHRSLARGDIQYMDNAWGDTRFPVVPSHEIIGLVEEKGSGVGDLQLGDRVGVGYQQASCMACAFCAQGEEQLCAQQKVIAVDCYGGLTERIVVDSRFAFPLPHLLDAAPSTPLLSSGLTVYAAIKRAQLSPGARVGVVGAGGLGHLAIQFLHKMGHRVTAFSHSPRKKGLIERLGGVFVDGSSAAELTRREGMFDFILSTLNVPFDLDAFVRLLTPKGQLCLVAAPLSPFALSGGLLNNSRRSIFGNYIGSRSETVEMLEFASTHHIGAVVDVMPFARVNDAIQRIRNGDVEMSLVLEG